ncbi:MAG: hypothetical protein IPN62_13295 [Flavobacteriales bacterium]|nr:hypothetical protein [Flavobacteriales bacterium]
MPREDRVQECAPDSIDQPGMPLLEMLTQELPPLLRSYHPGEITVLVGHSFTASFALYAYLRATDAFDAVIALSPLHQVKRSVPLVVDRLVERLDRQVLVAVGGAERLQGRWAPRHPGPCCAGRIMSGPKAGSCFARIPRPDTPPCRS